jgi:hypothetical protein
MFQAKQPVMSNMTLSMDGRVLVVLCPLPFGDKAPNTLECAKCGGLIMSDASLFKWRFIVEQRGVRPDMAQHKKASKTRVREIAVEGR